MANVKISELPAITSGSVINSTAVLPIVDAVSGTTMKITVSNLKGSITTGSMTQGSVTNKVIGIDSHAEGIFTTALGDYSHAGGFGSSAIGFGSDASGNSCKSSGSFSHAEGTQTTALGDSSHSENYQTRALGNYSHAEGNNTTSIGLNSHSEGQNNRAIGQNSHVGGFNNYAYGLNQQVIGANNNISDTGSIFIIGAGWSGTTVNGAKFTLFNSTGEKVSNTTNTTGSWVLPQVSSSLNFASDALASSSGVPLGGMYHTSGTLKIRLV